STGVYHTKPFHPEAPGAAEFPKDHWVQATGEHLVVGMFENEKKRSHFLAVNSDITTERTSRLTFQASVSLVERLDRKSGDWQNALTPSKDKAVLSVKLPPGGGDLFRVTRTK
nr:hypothetical protein [Roseibacillus sp.]